MKNKIKIRLLISAIILCSTSLTQAEEAAPPSENSAEKTEEVAPSKSDETSPLKTELPPHLRPKFNSEINNESSSFVPAPDLLDPLPIKKESLKEGEEPVLEDIKTFLKTKAKKKKSATDKTSENTPSQKKTKIKKTQKRLSITRNPDDPNFELEKSFNEKYRKYNLSQIDPLKWSQITDQVPHEYEIQKGDTLMSISQTLFGDSMFWPKIWALNSKDITNPHFIEPGMKIRFYPGSDSSAPGLSLATSEGVLTTLGQSTEFYKTHATQKKDRPVDAEIPESLPLYLSKALVPIEKKELEIQLSSRSEPPVKKMTNPYILTSEKLKSRFEFNDTEELICHEKSFIQNIEEAIENSGPGRYVLLTQEHEKFSTLNKTYVYRKIGVAEVTENKAFRILECETVIDSDVLVVRESDLQKLPEPNELTESEFSQVVEGFEVYSQKNFLVEQMVLINLKNLAVEDGEKLNVYSDKIGQNVGQIRVIKKYGTMALGQVLSSQRAISAGDKVLIPRFVE